LFVIAIFLHRLQLHRENERRMHSFQPMTKKMKSIAISPFQANAGSGAIKLR
jgi:hypothetical protein